MVNCHRGIGRVAVVFLWGVSVVLVWRLGAVARAAPVAQLPGTVVINEIAWGGTAASASDEWIELYNTTSLPVDLTGWVITSTGTLNIPLDGKTIAPNGYFLIERTDDNTVSDVAADVTASFGRGLSNSGTGLVLSAGGVTVDTANITGGAWPAGSGSPGYFTMARLDPLAPDTPANWTSNNGLYRNGSDAGGNPINGTPGQPNNSGLPPTPTLTPTETATPAPSPTETATPEPTLTATPLPTPPPDLLISEVLYDGTTSATEGDEFAEICNAGAAAANLTGVKLGDEESPGGGEGMFRLPDGMTLPPGGCLVIAKNSADFTARFGTPPDFEVSQLEKYSAWGSGSWSLANDGDELLLLGPSDEI
ncbi:MAG: lamin tail domain-containing protein, partial [Chloroflexi bacterium]